MRVSNTAEFGAAIRNRRKQLGITQGYLAEASGFSASFISDLENGKSTTELGKALFLSNLLGLDCSLDSRGELS